MIKSLNVETYEWTHPDMSEPLEVSIAFDSLLRYGGNDTEYEEIHPYIEAVYVGNTDIMPLMNAYDLIQCLKDYKESRNDD